MLDGTVPQNAHHRNRAPFVPKPPRQLGKEDQNLGPVHIFIWPRLQRRVPERERRERVLGIVGFVVQPRDGHAREARDDGGVSVFNGVDPMLGHLPLFRLARCDIRVVGAETKAISGECGQRGVRMVVELLRRHAQPPGFWHDAVAWEGVQDVFFVEAGEGGKGDETVVEGGAGGGQRSAADGTVEGFEMLVEDAEIIVWSEEAEAFDC